MRSTYPPRLAERRRKAGFRQGGEIVLRGPQIGMGALAFRDWRYLRHQFPAWVIRIASGMLVDVRLAGIF
jgi:hypothetical protein